MDVSFCIELDSRIFPVIHLKSGELGLTHTDALSCYPDRIKVVRIVGISHSERGFIGKIGKHYFISITLELSKLGSDNFESYLPCSLQ
jgi:hypothetical protein